MDSKTIRKESDSEKPEKNGADRRRIKDEKEHYSLVLDAACIEGKRITIPNLYPFHCRIAFERLLRFAVESQKTDDGGFIRLLTHGVNNYIFDNERLLSHFRNFFGARQGTLKVLLWRRDMKKISRHESKFFAFLKENIDSVDVRVVCTEFTRLSQRLLIDKYAYRVEETHDPNFNMQFSDTSPEVPAMICFNDPVRMNRMVAQFDDAFDFATNINERL